MGSLAACLRRELTEDLPPLPLLPVDGRGEADAATVPTIGSLTVLQDGHTGSRMTMRAVLGKEIGRCSTDQSQPTVWCAALRTDWLYSESPLDRRRDKRSKEASRDQHHEVKRVA